MLEDVGPWLGGARKEDGGRRVWELGLTLQDHGGGRNCLSHSLAPLYVYVCSLLSFSPVIVPKSLPDNVSKEPSLFIHSLVLCSAGLRLSYILRFH